MGTLNWITRIKNNLLGKPTQRNLTQEWYEKKKLELLAVELAEHMCRAIKMNPLDSMVTQRLIALHQGVADLPPHPVLDRHLWHIMATRDELERMQALAMVMAQYDPPIARQTF